MAENKLKNPFVVQDEQKKSKRATSTKVKVKTSQDGKKIVEEVDNEIKTGLEDKDVFREYVPLYEIANNIANELIGKYAYQEPGKFVMSSDIGLRRVGLMSLFPALSTGIRLYLEMSEPKAKEELLSKINIGIETVFKIIYREKEGTKWQDDIKRVPVFDASPYESEAFYAGSDFDDLNGRSYIDSISWAVTLFIKVMNSKEKEKFIFADVYREEAKKLIKWCLRYVNNAVLTIKKEDKEEEKEYQRPVGWNFSNVKSKNAEAQRSLYFTYAAASMYLTLYEEYKDIIDNLQTLNRVRDKVFLVEKDMEEKAKKEINAKKEIFLLRSKEDFKYVEEEIEKYEKTLGDEAKADGLWKALENLEPYKRNKNENPNKLDEYYDFNDDKSAEYNGKIYLIDDLKSLGSISLLKWTLEKISEDIWEEAKNMLEDKFVYDNFKFEEATKAAIESGGQTNALFAGLLLISICLYSRYDFVVSYTEKNDPEKYGEKAYNNMQSTMLLHVQRAQRFFDDLLERGKAFGVDFLILRFSEDFSDDDFSDDDIGKGNLTDRETAEKLRKQLIRITSLTPMLLKTNNLISQYVVKYPQKQMGESIAKIGDKRFYDRKNNMYLWFWESDGYHAMSNYYYVGAIFDFYEYYKNYEQPYATRIDKLKELLSEDDKYAKSAQKYYQRIADEKEQLKDDYEKKLEDIEAKIKAKDAELDAMEKRSSVGNQLIESISKVVKSEVEKPEFLKMIIEGLRNQLAQEVFNRYSKNPNDYRDKDDLEKLKIPVDPKDNSLFSLLQALAADIILQSAIDDKKDKGTGEVSGLGKDPDNGFWPAEVALSFGEQLIKGNLINFLFAGTCDPVNFEKPQKTKKEK